MMKNLIVFDIDDTLTRSETQHQSSYVDTMKHFGITEINEKWSEYEHMTDSYILKKNYEHNLKKSFNFEFIEPFEHFMTKRMIEFKPCEEVNGANAIIEHIKLRTNYGFCCATGSFRKPALLKLSQARLNCPEEIVVGSNEFLSREEIVREAIERAKLFYRVDKFKNIISIGDGLWDERTASNLGIHFIGIGNKTNFKEQNTLFHIEDWRSFEFNLLERKLNL